MKRMRLCLLLVLAMLLGGCSGHRAFQAGEELSRQGRYDQAFLQYAEAVRAYPERHQYRLRMGEARTKAARAHMENGRRLLAQGAAREALAEFGQATALDPSNRAAVQEMQKLQSLLKAEELTAEAEQRLKERKSAQAKILLEEALRLDPDQSKAAELLGQVREKERRTMVDGMELDVASDKPITLKFKDADIKDVFTILTKLSGINFIFDEDIRAQRISILLEDGTFAQALQLLLRMNNLEKKILNAKTIIIYPNTKEKGKKFEDQVIQTFYLSNIEAKKAVNMLRTMLQLRKIYVHEELNALVIRDTPATVRLAQQILEAADRADSEVIFDLELVEVGRTDRLNLGTRISGDPNSISFGLAKPGTDTIPATVTTSGLSRLQFLYQVPSANFTFDKQRTDSEILANPKIRVKNREKAKVHIGSREPIVTNTLTASGDVTSTNVQYVDVGVKLDVEPNIQLDNSIVTKLNLEVSSVSNRRPIGDGGRGGEALTITTTNAQTSLILRDGEQTIIGGLIRDDFTKSKEAIPLLGDIPLLGNLISGHTREKIKREILLSITPHILKKIEVPAAEVATIWSGGEDDLQPGPRFGAFANFIEPEVQQAPPAAVPGMQPAVPAGRPSLPERPLPPVTAPEAIPDLSAEEEPLPSANVAPVRPSLILAGPAEVPVDSELALEIRATAVEKLFSAPLFVRYDKDHLVFVRAEEGDFLRSAGHGTVFSTAANAGAGEVIVGHKQEAGGAGVSGEGILFRLLFRTRTTGPARVALERINFRDPAGRRLELDDAEILVDVR